MIHRSPDNKSMPMAEEDKNKAIFRTSETDDSAERDWTDKSEDEIIAEIIECLTDYELERLISNSELINSGNNGLIYKIDLDYLEEAAQNGELMKKLKIDTASSGENGKTKKGSKVMKILKVYKEGMGHHEYTMQKRAYDVVSGASNKKELAQIPKPISFKKLNISKETQEALNQKGASLADDKAEIILMDYIEAEDLATIIYQWVIDNHPNQELNPGLHRSIEEMQQTVALLLGFERPGGKGADEGGRNLEERKVYAANADKLYRFLQKSGFKMDSSIVSQVKNTLDLLHRNGIYHNDPHERNIMIKGAYNKTNTADGRENPQAYIVDFGSTANEKTEGRVDDGYLINRLAELTDSPEETRRKEAIDKLETRFNNMKKSEAWTLRYENLAQKIQHNAAAALEQEFTIALCGEDKLEEFIAALSRLKKDGKISKEEVTKFLNEKTKPIPLQTGRKKQPEPLLPPWVRNKLALYKSIF